MSTKVTKASIVLDEDDEAKKLIKNVKVEKEKVKIYEQSFVDEDEEEIDIRPDKYITVINLCAGQLNLSTLPGGRGKTFTFHSFGGKKRILYSNLVDVIETSQRFLEEGYFYIADKKVIAKHGLDDIYSKLLTKETIENIFFASTTEEDVATLYKSANKNQQDVIINLLVRKLVEGTELDLNIVSTISRLSKIDILAKVEEAKFYSQPQLEET